MELYGLPLSDEPDKTKLGRRRFHIELIRSGCHAVRQHAIRFERDDCPS